MKKQEANGASSPPAGRGAPLGAKPSYGRLNVNQTYPPAKPTAGAGPASAARPAAGSVYGSRMLVLGKGSKAAPSGPSKPGPLGAGKVVAPRPVNLPSIKSEAGALDSAPAPWAPHTEGTGSRSHTGVGSAASGSGAPERDGPWARRDEAPPAPGPASASRGGYPSSSGYPSMSGRAGRPPRPDEFPSLSRAAQMTPTQPPPTRTPSSGSFNELRGSATMRNDGMRGSAAGPPMSIARRNVDELPRRPAAASPVSAPSSSPPTHFASPARSAPSTAASTPARPAHVASVSAPTTPAVMSQGDGGSSAPGVDWASAALDEEMDFEKPLMFADSSPADEARLREQAAAAEAQRRQEEEEEEEERERERERELVARAKARAAEAAEKEARQRADEREREARQKAEADERDRHNRAAEQAHVASAPREQAAPAVARTLSAKEEELKGIVDQKELMKKLAEAKAEQRKQEELRRQDEQRQNALAKLRALDERHAAAAAAAAAAAPPVPVPTPKAAEPKSIAVRPNKPPAPPATSHNSHAHQHYNANAPQHQHQHQQRGQAQHTHAPQHVPIAPPIGHAHVVSALAPKPSAWAPLPPPQPLTPPKPRVIRIKEKPVNTSAAPAGAITAASASPSSSSVSSTAPSSSPSVATSVPRRVRVVVKTRPTPPPIVSVAAPVLPPPALDSVASPSAATPSLSEASRVVRTIQIRKKTKPETANVKEHSNGYHKNAPPLASSAASSRPSATSSYSHHLSSLPSVSSKATTPPLTESSPSTDSVSTTSVPSTSSASDVSTTSSTAPATSSMSSSSIATVTATPASKGAKEREREKDAKLLHEDEVDPELRAPVLAARMNTPAAVNRSVAKPISSGVVVVQGERAAGGEEGFVAIKSKSEQKAEKLQAKKKLQKEQKAQRLQQQHQQHQGNAKEFNKSKDAQQPQRKFAAAPSPASVSSTIPAVPAAAPAKPVTPPPAPTPAPWAAVAVRSTAPPVVSLVAIQEEQALAPVPVPTLAPAAKGSGHKDGPKEKRKRKEKGDKEAKTGAAANGAAPPVHAHAHTHATPPAPQPVVPVATHNANGNANANTGKRHPQRPSKGAHANTSRTDMNVVVAPVSAVAHQHHGNGGSVLVAPVPQASLLAAQQAGDEGDGDTDLVASHAAALASGLLSESPPPSSPTSAAYENTAMVFPDHTGFPLYTFPYSPPVMQPRTANAKDAAAAQRWSVEAAGRGFFTPNIFGGPLMYPQNAFTLPLLGMGMGMSIPMQPRPGVGQQQMDEAFRAWPAPFFAQDATPFQHPAPPRNKPPAGAAIQRPYAGRGFPPNASNAAEFHPASEKRGGGVGRRGGGGGGSAGVVPGGHNNGGDRAAAGERGGRGRGRSRGGANSNNNGAGGERRVYQPKLVPTNANPNANAVASPVVALSTAPAASPAPSAPALAAASAVAPIVPAAEGASSV